MPGSGQFRRQKIEYQAYAPAGIQFAVRGEPDGEYNGLKLRKRLLYQGLSVAYVLRKNPNSQALFDHLPLHNMIFCTYRKVALSQV